MSSDGVAAQADADARQGLSDVADLAYLLGHEFNNFLNSLFLHLSIWELSGQKGKVATDAGAIRSLGRELAEKVQRFQQWSRKCRPSFEPVDLNQVAEAALSRAKDAATFSVHTELADGLPPVLASFTDLGHLVELLIQAAAAALPASGGQVNVKTTLNGSLARLRVEDNGPPVADEELPRLFEPFTTVRPGSDGLRLAICRALVRRLQGSIQAENRSPGPGVVVVVDLPLVTA